MRLSKIKLAGFNLERRLLGQIAHGLDVRVPEERVIIERHLRVECDDAIVGGQNQRIDLDHRAVAVEEQLVECLEQLGEGFGLVAGETELGGELADLVGSVQLTDAAPHGKHLIYTVTLVIKNKEPFLCNLNISLKGFYNFNCSKITDNGLAENNYQQSVSKYY